MTPPESGGRGLRAVEEDVLTDWDREHLPGNLRMGANAIERLYPNERWAIRCLRLLALEVEQSEAGC